MTDPLRHHRDHDASAFGSDRFGRLAERFARCFGTPRFIAAQTVLIVVWMTLNGVVLARGWDPYPWILLNLLFSTQAAYAAPLILLAQTRQAARDKALSDADAHHRQEIADAQQAILAAIHDVVREDTPGGLASVERKLDTLLGRAGGGEPIGDTTQGGW